MTTKQLALAIDLPPAPPEPQRTNARRRKSLKKSPQEKAREREAEYAAAMATAIARLPQFRFGTIVEQRNRCGLVVGKARSPEIPQLWIRWESCCEFRVYEKFPECVLLDDSLTVRSQRPKPNLPADVPPHDSLTTSTTSVEVSLKSESSVSESSVSESSVSESPCSLHKYYPRGEARGHNAYYRVSWREWRGQPKHRHVKGGNIWKPGVEEKAEQIREAIARRDPLEDILKMCD